MFFIHVSVHVLFQEKNDIHFQNYPFKKTVKITTSNLIGLKKSDLQNKPYLSILVE